jgi:peptidyl-prolyl cis-trans isomerase C
MIGYKVAMPRPHQIAPPVRRLPIAAAVVALMAAPIPGRAQHNNDKPPAYEPGESLKDVHDPVVAIVDGRELHLTDLGDLVRDLAPEDRTIPFNTLFPALLANLVDHAALEQKARRLHLDEDPAVRRRMNTAAGRALEQALLEQLQGQQVTEQALVTSYNEIYGGKTTVDEVQVRVMLLGTEADAVKAQARLQAGEDFATVAREMSRDSSAPRGGDLGFLRREQMQPDIAAAAFSLKPQETTPRPVRTRNGWYIIKVEQRISAPRPSFDSVRDELSRLLTQQMIRRAAVAARAEVSVRQFNLDGSPAGDQNGKSTP